MVVDPHRELNSLWLITGWTAIDDALSVTVLGVGQSNLPPSRGIFKT